MNGTTPVGLWPKVQCADREENRRTGWTRLCFDEAVTTGPDGDKLCRKHGAIYVVFNIYKQFERSLGDRKLVDCDDADCLAFDEPKGDDVVELRAAYEHWRRHEWCSGCSHGE